MLAEPERLTWQLLSTLATTLNELDIPHTGHFYHASGDAYLTVVTTAEYMSRIRLEHDYVTVEDTTGEDYS
jgi:hypothetical protein